MPKFFICYRREDSKYPAQMIAQKLASEYDADSVVFDVDSVPLGADFREYLDNQVSKCDVLLAVIGARWLDILKEREGHRNDSVRVEIESALGRNIPVVPVLLEGVSMPGEDSLPRTLAKLAYKNAAEVHAGKDLTVHLDRLLVGLEHLLKEREKARKAEAEAEATLRVTQIREEDDKLNPRIRIEGGTFQMGSADDNPDANDNEKPKHPVTVSSFWIQEHPVTNVEYRRFKPLRSFNAGKERHPVVIVSWREAMDYAAWLGGTLPTEAQWEYAARGTEGRKYPWGSEDPTPERSNYRESGIGNTTPVGAYPKGATPEGVHDLAGNVSEWCSDWYDRYTDDEQVDPAGPAVGMDIGGSAARVLRGGAFRRQSAARPLRLPQLVRSVRPLLLRRVSSGRPRSILNLLHSDEGVDERYGRICVPHLAHPPRLDRERPQGCTP